MVLARVRLWSRLARRNNHVSSFGLSRSKIFWLSITILPITAPEASSSASEGTPGVWRGGANDGRENASRFSLLARPRLPGPGASVPESGPGSPAPALDRGLFPSGPLEELIGAGGSLAASARA